MSDCLNIRSSKYMLVCAISISLRIDFNICLVILSSVICGSITLYYNFFSELASGYLFIIFLKASKFVPKVYLFRSSLLFIQVSSFIYSLILNYKYLACYINEENYQLRQIFFKINLIIPI